MPAFSNSVVIAAPLRVLVPHVDVRITASTPSCFIFSAISRPRRRVFESGFERPQVEMNSLWSLPMMPRFSISRMAGARDGRGLLGQTWCRNLRGKLRILHPEDQNALRYCR